ncbi:MAG: hypothetical protein OHK0046_01510 [Anaerolineae bacterium]
MSWKLVLLITPRTEHAHTIGEAWQQAGASGVTYFESHGLYRLQQARHGLEVPPGMLSLFEILRGQDQHNITILSVVAGEQVEPLVKATESIIGALTEPNNGILFSMDVEHVFGLRSTGN